MRRSLALGAAALLAVSGCSVGSGTGGSGGDAEITFLTFETPNLTPAYWDAAIQRVTGKNPGIKVKKLVAPTADGRTDVRQAAAAVGPVPGRDDRRLDRPGSPRPATSTPGRPSELKDFVSRTANPINGKYYQLPANTQTIPPVYYNKKMFAEAGITAPPKTWAELLRRRRQAQGQGLRAVRRRRRQGRLRRRR